MFTNCHAADFKIRIEHADRELQKTRRTNRTENLPRIQKSIQFESYAFLSPCYQSIFFNLEFFWDLFLTLRHKRILPLLSVEFDNNLFYSHHWLWVKIVSTWELDPSHPSSLIKVPARLHEWYGCSYKKRRSPKPAATEHLSMYSDGDVSLLSYLKPYEFF